MAITNLKELVTVLSDPTRIGTVVPKGVDTGTLRVNPLAQTLTNIDAVTSTIPLAVDPLITVVDVGTTAVRTVEDGQTVVLITGPQGPVGPPGTSGTLGADGRNGVGIESIAVSAGGNLLVELDNGTTVDAGLVNLALSIGSVTQGSTVGASITGAGLATELNLVLPNTTALGLGNVTNESKATMFSNPTFTGTVSGVTAAHVGLGSVTNESKLTMFSNPTFTGTVSGVTAAHVGLGNVTNESKLTMFASPEFTGVPIAPTATAGTNTTQLATTQYVRTEVANLVNSAPGALDTLDELAAALGDDASFATTVTTAIGLKAPLESPTFTGTVTGITKTMVGLGNVLNETKATAFTNPTFTGTVTAPTVLLATAGFSITQVDTKLLFRYNGVTIASMDSTGNIISAANVTGFGTP
jgi:hypothetical protein